MYCSSSEVSIHQSLEKYHFSTKYEAAKTVFTVNNQFFLSSKSAY